jgi:hypothetical protein
MKKIIALLGLAIAATEEMVLKAIEDLKEQLSNQVKIGMEYSKFKADLEVELGSSDVLDKVKELKELAETRDGMITDLETDITNLEAKVEKISKEKAVGQISNKEIDKLVNDAFAMKENVDVKELWGTGDGHLFKQEQQAKDHKHFIGGPIKHYIRD